MPSPRSISYPRAAATGAGGRCFLAVLAGALATAGLLLAGGMPMSFILPALGVLMVLAGLTTAGVLYLAGWRLSGALSPAWEVACALVFLGFAAGILGDGREAVTLLHEIYAALAQRSPA